MRYLLYVLRFVAAFIVNRPGDVAGIAMLILYPFSWGLLGLAFLIGTGLNILRGYLSYMLCPLTGMVLTPSSDFVKWADKL